jgi:Nif-specific regulatory protein
MTVSRLLSERGDMNAAMDTLLYYMRKELRASKAMVSLVHGDSGKLFLSRSAGFTDDEGEALRRPLLSPAQSRAIPRQGAAGLAQAIPADGFLGPGGDGGAGPLTVPITREGKVLGALSALAPLPDERARKNLETQLHAMASLFSGEARLYMTDNIDRVVLEKKVRALSSEIYELRERLSPSSLVSCSPAMQDVYFLLRKVASRRTIVLILGERGVEKGTVAQSIHYDGLKAMGPFVSVSCADFPPELLGPVLFGPGPGQGPGLLEAADGGSIFIDEIDLCPLALQARLLEALSSGPDARVIAGSSQDLRELADRGLFLEELFYRLNVFPISIPPLRKREDDIPRLARHFLARYSGEQGKKLKSISPQAMESLVSYAWPGNVEELEAVIHRAVSVANRESPALEAQDLPPHLRFQAGPGSPGPLGLEERLSSIEHGMISEALKRHRGNVSKAAQDLRLTRRSMGLRMKRLSLSYKDFRA